MASLNHLLVKFLCVASIVTSSVALPNPLQNSNIGARQVGTPKNPIVQGWYGDPDAKRFGDTYWVYPTTSTDGTYIDAFSSKDLVTWTKHPKVFTANDSAWAKTDIWAPSVVERGNKYYIYYAAHAQSATGEQGIGVGVADSPQGPFKDPINKPLVQKLSNGAIPIDPQVFHDDDGKDYLIWGNGKSLIAPLDVTTSTLDLNNLKDITPNKDYEEASWMLKYKGLYYFMWSVSTWDKPNYHVEYATSTSLFGPWTSKGTILQQDGKIATAPGHHAVLQTGTDQFSIVYQRRAIGQTVNTHRVLAIDKLNIHDGTIDPVVMT